MITASMEGEPTLLLIYNTCDAGTNAPDFTLPSNTGKDISLKSLAGKRTVLYFYPVSKVMF